MVITIDEMLDLLSYAGAELGSGNANHGPMAAEALFALGRDEADAHQAVRYTWQACAGIYSWYSTTLPQDSESWETPPSPGALRNGIKPSSGDAIRSLQTPKASVSLRKRPPSH